MFHKKEESIVKKNYYNQGSVYDCRYVNLSKNRVMLITKFDDESNNFTNIKIFYSTQPDIYLAEVVLYGHFDFKGLFPDESFLLVDHASYINSLIKMSSTDLSILSTQKCRKEWHEIGILDNSSFFIVELKNKNYYCVVYQWNGEEFVVSQEPFKLSISNLDASAVIVSLGGNRYAIQEKDDEIEFKILIVDIHFNEMKKKFDLKEVTTILSTLNRPSYTSPLSGRIISLANGHLLTYSGSVDHVQIWDTETGQCVKEWNWSDIKMKKNFNVWCLNISAFPDAIHLLVTVASTLYIFNMDNLSIKIIPFRCGTKLGTEHVHILPNCQAIVYENMMRDDILNDKYKMKVSHIHIKETNSFRGDYAMSKLTSQRLLYSLLPQDIAGHIFSLAFESENTPLFFKPPILKLENEVNEKNKNTHDTNKKEKCIVM